jgi:adenylate cyclase
MDRDGDRALSAAELWRRNLRRSALAIALSNAVAAVVVFVYLAFVVPTPVVDTPHARLLNLITLVVFLGVVFPVGTIWSLRRVRPTAAWMTAGRAPTPAERDYTLRGGLYQLEILAVGWAAGALVFFAVNLTISAALAVEVLATVVLGGVVTCAMGYLLLERINRSNLALVLSIGPPPRPAAPGVGTRLLLTWAIGTAVFLLAIVALAVAVLVAPGATTLRRMSASVLFLGAAGVLVGAVSMIIGSRTVTDPLESVRSALREVESGRTDVEVRVDDGSEIGLLQAGFNRMVGGLREHERLRDLFGRHVGEDVARRALERGVELGGEIRDAAVLFVDVVGSTELAATRPPEEVVAKLNTFFGVVVDVVRARGGLVNKFEGDAALCIFGAPLAIDDPAGCALAAGRELAARLAGELPAGIGISAGPVVAGNVGARDRYEYTVIGDPVNEAARLTELAKQRPGRLLASEAVLSRAGAEEAACWQLDGSVQLRGRPDATRVALLR